MLFSVCVCPLISSLTHAFFSSILLDLPPERQRGFTVRECVCVFVYVNKGVYSSARWTRLKAADARAASGDNKHSGVHEAFMVIILGSS